MAWAARFVGQKRQWPHGWGLSECFGFHLQSEHIHERLNGNSKLSVGVLATNEKTSISLFAL